MKNLKQSWLPAFWKKIQNTQEIKRTLFNKTKKISWFNCFLLYCTQLEKDDNIENLHVLIFFFKSCSVLLKSVLLISCVFCIFYQVVEWENLRAFEQPRQTTCYASLFPRFVYSKPAWVSLNVTLCKHSTSRSLLLCSLQHAAPVSKLNSLLVVQFLWRSSFTQNRRSVCLKK